MNLLAAVLGILILFPSAAGCERGAEASRAALAERRASWAREIAGLKEQHSALAARVDGRIRSGVGADEPAVERRMRATLDGAHQSIADVEVQLRQTEERIERAIRQGGGTGEKAMTDESGQARGHLQALGDQLGDAAKQIDEFVASTGEAKHTTP